MHGKDLPKYLVQSRHSINVNYYYCILCHPLFLDNGMWQRGQLMMQACWCPQVPTD